MGLYRLSAEMQAHVLVHLSSTRDFGRASCVCCAWRADGSPVEQALRERIKARDGAVPTAFPGAGTMMQRMCWFELLHDARMATGVISLGDDASAVVDADGHLCVWGEIDDPETELIFSHTTPTVVQTARIEHVSVGSYHTLALTETGEVLSFGFGEEGQLGHGDEANQFVPKVIEALLGMRVVAIAAGGFHSLVLTDEGAVLSFGGRIGGQLGHGDVNKLLKPKVIEALGGVRVVAIAAGDDHSMVLTDAGEVLSFGWGMCGRLGHGDEAEDKRKPEVIKALRGRRVVAIAAGRAHSMVLTDEGKVLSFGGGGCGQLGHGGERDRYVPKVIEALRGTRVVAIAAGSYQSMVLTDEGAVLSFGDGWSGQLGHGDEERQLVPKVIEALGDRRVVAISKGDGHSMVLTDEGEVLSFGYGRKGQLGHGDDENGLVPKMIAGLRAFRR